MNGGSEPMGSQTEKSATRTNIKKTFSSQIFKLKHLPQRPFCFFNVPFVKEREKPAPVLAKLKSITAGDFARVSFGFNDHVQITILSCRHHKSQLAGLGTKTSRP